jgi:hypothetical protein
MNLYSSPYSSIDLDKESKLMSVQWHKECSGLGEDAVIEELSKILHYLKEYTISYVLVDSRNYPFRSNENLQRWINFTYMPKVIDFGVLRYALVVNEKLASIFEDFQDEDDVEDDLAVEYFTDTEAALQWIQSAQSGQ